MISNRCARKSLVTNCNSIISKNYLRFLVDSNDFSLFLILDFESHAVVGVRVSCCTWIQLLTSIDNLRVAREGNILCNSKLRWFQMYPTPILIFAY